MFTTFESITLHFRHPSNATSTPYALTNHHLQDSTDLTRTLLLAYNNPPNHLDQYVAASRRDLQQTQRVHRWSESQSDQKMQT
jgi:hypothetical protein